MTNQQAVPLGSGQAHAASLRQMPKIELHCHLEGCLRPQTFVELARSKGVPLPTSDPSLVYEYHDMTSFLAIFERLGALLQTRADFARLTYESLADAAQVGVIYREMFFNPTTHPDCSYPEMLAGICEGMVAAELDHGIVSRLIPSIYRGHDPAAALGMVEQVVEHRRDEVVGVGIDGDELEGPPAMFVEAFALAGRAGLHRTAHAGERFSATEVRESLDLLGCTRIDHGYGVLADADLLRRCSDQQVHFTCAWLSTAYHYRGALHDHPFARMRQAGLSMSLGSDDPAMGGTDLAGDYLTVADALGWPIDVLREQRQQALDAAWCPPEVRRSLRERIDASSDVASPA